MEIGQDEKYIKNFLIVLFFWLLDLVQQYLYCHDKKSGKL